MKKILATIGSLSLLASSLVTAGCSFGQNEVANFKELIKEDVQIAAYGARAGMLSTNLQYDPQYAMDHYGKKKLVDVFPDQYSEFAKNSKVNDTTTMYQMYSSLFNASRDNNYDWIKSNASKAGITFTGTKQPFDNSILSVLSDIAPLFLILSQGLNPTNVANISSILSSSKFASLLSEVSAITPYLNANLLNGLANSFNDEKYLTQINFTYNWAMQICLADISNFLQSILKTPVSDKYIPVQNYSSSLPAITLKNLTDIFESLIKNGITSDLTTALLNNPSGHGLPDLVSALLLLGNYISQFPLNFHPTSSNHLFSANETNIQVKQRINKEIYHKTTINIQGIISFLKICFSSDNTNDPNGYNTQKLLYILFANQDKNKAKAFTEFSEDSFYNLASPAGTDYIWGPLFKALLDGVIKGEVGKQPAFITTLVINAVNALNLPTLLQKILFDISTNASSFGKPGSSTQNTIVDFLGNFSKLLQTLKGFPLIPESIKNDIGAINTVVELLSTDLGNIKNSTYRALYQGGLIKNIMAFLSSADVNTALAKLGIRKKISIPSDIQNDFADLKTTFNNPIDSILKLFGVAIPNWLYLLKGVTWNQALADLTQEFDIKNVYSNSFPNGIITTQDGALFTSMAKMADITDPSVAQIPDLEPGKTTTIAYALSMMQYANIPGAGVLGGFELLGLNPNQTTTFNKDSVLQDLAKNYDGGGLTKIFLAVGRLDKDIQDGMQDNENTNFLPHMTNAHFLLNPNNLKITQANGITTVQFQVEYKDVGIDKLYSLEMTITNTGQIGYAKFGWLGVKNEMV